MQSNNTTFPPRRFWIRLAAFTMLLAALGAAACASTSVKGEYEVSAGTTKKF